MGREAREGKARAGRFGVKYAFPFSPSGEQLLVGRWIQAAGEERRGGREGKALSGLHTCFWAVILGSEFDSEAMRVREGTVYARPKLDLSNMYKNKI